jgi:pSer/pThr/pTyr-binding forkhead associated (FHA) protein
MPIRETEAMNVKLIVASGKSAGRAITIKRSTLLIGRAEDCDVRPLSDEVSRRHCAVHIGPADVWVEDLGSRNGTLVNGSRITGKVKVADGDTLRVGTLELKVSLSAPAAVGNDEEVSRWLMADEQPAGMFDTTQSIRTPPQAVESASVLDDSAVKKEGASGISREALDAVKASKASPGMLPPSAKKESDSSRDAAAEALKKFFGNR